MIKLNKDKAVKSAVFILLPIVLVLILFFLYRKYYFNNNFINKKILKKDMEFNFFTYDEMDSPKGSKDIGVETYYRNGKEYIANSGKENFSTDTLKKLDAARTEIENSWNVLNPDKKIVFKINSAYRTDSYNEKVGGVKNSAHRNLPTSNEKAKAVDISWYKYNNEQKKVIEAALRKQGFNRIGKANSFIHADNSKRLPNPANWTY